MTSLPRIFIDLYRRLSHRDVDFSNVSILSCAQMVPVLATEGKLRQTETCARCQQCVEANGAGAGAFNDGKWTNDGAIGPGSNFLPYLSAILVLKIRRNWYKSLRTSEDHQGLDDTVTVRPYFFPPKTPPRHFRFQKVCATTLTITSLSRFK
jgi:hypothetical protein